MTETPDTKQVKQFREKHESGSSLSTHIEPFSSRRATLDPTKEQDARGSFYQPKQFLELQLPLISKRKSVSPDNWDNRWHLTYSKANDDRHPFYKEFFGKQPAEKHYRFQYEFGHMSPNALPGIVDAHKKPLPKSFFKGGPAHKDLVQMTKETRMPIEQMMIGIISPKGGGENNAFPDPIDHFAKADAWKDYHNITVSNFNNTHHKSQREYFDSPIKVPQKGYSHIRKDKAVPFSVYAAQTPMRSAAACQNLLDSYKRVQQEEKILHAPKQGYGYSPGMDTHRSNISNTLSNDYGKIPNLRRNGKLPSSISMNKSVHQRSSRNLTTVQQITEPVLRNKRLSATNMIKQQQL